MPVKKAIEKAVVAGQEAAPIIEEVAPTDPLMTLEEAANRFVEGHRSHHLPGILSFAQHQGFKEPATESSCKALLKKWGAKIKV